MIMRRVIGLVILTVIILGGAVLYKVLSQKVAEVESDLTIVEKKDLRGQK